MFISLNNATSSRFKQIQVYSTWRIWDEVLARYGLLGQSLNYLYRNEIMLDIELRIVITKLVVIDRLLKLLDTSHQIDHSHFFYKNVDMDYSETIIGRNISPLPQLVICIWSEYFWESILKMLSLSFLEIKIWLILLLSFKLSLWRIRK